MTNKALGLRAAAYELFQECAPEKKYLGIHIYQQNFDCDSSHFLEEERGRIFQEPSVSPGRPQSPELVDPKQLSNRGVATQEARACLLHALCHIEFNAINLALDVLWRFPNMPDSFYFDWWKVAYEEAVHFKLLSDHLIELDSVYGAYPAHNGLWEMAQRTRADLLARMALVPRTLEARGLDVTPSIRAKLAQAGDNKAANILDMILRDEIGHVQIGNKWYHYCCEKEGLEPIATYRTLARSYRAPRLKKPFNTEARLAAGFSLQELQALEEA